jgi:hypothetical protein
LALGAATGGAEVVQPAPKRTTNAVTMDIFFINDRFNAYAHIITPAVQSANEIMAGYKKIAVKAICRSKNRTIKVLSF